MNRRKWRKLINNVVYQPERQGVSECMFLLVLAYPGRPV